MAEKKDEEAVYEAMLPYAIFMAGMLVGVFLYATDKVLALPVPLLDVAALIVAALTAYAAYRADRADRHA